jgi:hypothetical protein
MSVISVVSAKSCGVTTSALAMALSHPRPSLLAECDPSGGSIRFGWLQGRLHATVGLGQLAAPAREGVEALAAAFEHNLLRLDEAGDRQLLAGLTDPRQAMALADAWEALAQMLQLMDHEAGYHVLVDGGRLAVEGRRLHPVLSPVAVLRRSDIVLLAVRSEYRSLEESVAAAEILRDEVGQARGAEGVGLLVIDSGRYPVGEISDYLKLPVLGLLAWDAPTAGYLGGGGRMPRGFERSALMRSARTAVDRCVEVAERRRVQAQWGLAATHSPVVAGVLNRLTHTRTGGSR